MMCRGNLEHRITTTIFDFHYIITITLCMCNRTEGLYNCCKKNYDGLFLIIQVEFEEVPSWLISFNFLYHFKLFH